MYLIGCKPKFFAIENYFGPIASFLVNSFLVFGYFIYHLFSLFLIFAQVKKPLPSFLLFVLRC